MSAEWTPTDADVEDARKRAERVLSNPNNNKLLLTRWVALAADKAEIDEILAKYVDRAKLLDYMVKHTLSTEKHYRRFECLDCDTNTMEAHECYMVHDSVWESVVKGRGMLCLRCLEKRLGRKLTSADFTDAPLNKRARKRSVYLNTVLKRKAPAPAAKKRARKAT